jgi:beta-galactosidase
VELHRDLVLDEFAPIAKPQNVGNHEDVRWCALTNNEGNGAVFVATDRLSVTALPYSAMDLTMASHPFQLPAIGDTYLNLDIAVTGLGGSSCGPTPLEQDKVRATPHSMGFIIRAAAGKDLNKIAAVSASGEVPISIMRTRAGEVKIGSTKKGAVIYYTLNNSKPNEYTQAIPLREAGVITAWFKENVKAKTVMMFNKIENVRTTVHFASSEELGQGDASNLTDGDPNTIWHTAYSVTVAKYPHWVDLDVGDAKLIKGFTYLPRQDGTNGHIKNYSIHVSMDGKNWGAQPLMKAKFENNAAEKRVIFDKPVKARYIRFTALSEQRGQDYATGAEITIIAE